MSVLHATTLQQTEFHCCFILQSIKYVESVKMRNNLHCCT